MCISRAWNAHVFYLTEIHASIRVLRLQPSVINWIKSIFFIRMHSWYIKHRFLLKLWLYQSLYGIKINSLHYFKIVCGIIILKKKNQEYRSPALGSRSPSASTALDAIPSKSLRGVTANHMRMRSVDRARTRATIPSCLALKALASSSARSCLYTRTCMGIIMGARLVKRKKKLRPFLTGFRNRPSKLDFR